MLCQWFRLTKRETITEKWAERHAMPVVLSDTYRSNLAKVAAGDFLASILIAKAIFLCFLA